MPTCTKCGGSGKVKCNGCGGTGSSSSEPFVCAICNGEGKETCSTCSGRGSTWEKTGNISEIELCVFTIPLVILIKSKTLLCHISYCYVAAPSRRSNKLDPEGPILPPFALFWRFRPPAPWNILRHTSQPTREDLTRDPDCAKSWVCLAFSEHIADSNWYSVGQNDCVTFPVPSHDWASKNHSAKGMGDSRYFALWECQRPHVSHGYNDVVCPWSMRYNLCDKDILLINLNRLTKIRKRRQ